MHTKIVLKNWLYTVTRIFLRLAPSINIVSPKDKHTLCTAIKRD